ncbi:hypothetical protein WJX82_006322 [Trebouxia sp. C0006]
MGFELDSTWQEPRGIGQGLENQGATCYINSIVQCLVHNPIIANLAFGTLRQTCKCVKCALCYLAFRTRCSLDADHVSPERKASYPRWMISAGLPTLGTQSNERLSACKQEDAHDFLRQWLDKVHDLHEKILKNGLPSKQPVYTIIDQVFGGVLASRVECQHCGQVSSMYDSMNDLSVEVDNGCYGVVKSVEIALGKFIQPEVMSGENAYHCDRCQRKQTAHKSLHIHTAPNTLTLHLKRFRPDFVKLTGHIAFPLTLNLTPFLSPDSPEQAPQSAFCQEPAACPHQQPAFSQRAAGFAQKGPAFREQRVTYRLIGVLVHKGSWSSAGHYFSYVLDSDGQWWLMNDELRYQVSPDEVLNKCDAYILFYVRHQPRQQYPVVPPSHVDKPPTRKRCPPLSPLEDGEDGEAAGIPSGLMRETDASHHNSLSSQQQQQQQQQQAHTMHASKQQLPQQLPAALSQQQRTKQHQSDQLPSLHQRQPAPSFMGRKQPSWSRPPSDLLSSDAPPHIKYAPPQARSQLLGNPSGPPAQQQLPLKGGSACRPNGHLGGFSQTNGHSSQGLGALPAASLAATGMLGRMKSTVTSFFQPKAAKQPSASQELKGLAELYPSDDGSD